MHLGLAPVTDRVQWSRSTLSKVLLDFVRQIERANIPIGVLRGHDEFPRARDGRDIDLVAHRRHRRAIEDALYDVCMRHEARIWARFRSGFLTQYHLYAYDAHTGHNFFEIDVHTSECCFGVPILSSEAMLSALDSASERVPVPSRPHLTVANFLGPFLSGGEVQRRYAEPLQRSLEDEPDETSGILESVFGARLGGRLADTLHDPRRREHVRPGPYRRACLLRAFLRRPLHSLGSLLTFLWGVRIAPLFFPRGLFVGFLGTDGSGKSAILSRVEERVGPVFRGSFSKTFYMRPGLLPRLRSLLTLRRTSYTPAETSEPHGSKPSGAIGSWARVLYYWLDFVLGYALLVLPRRRRHSLILFDRYFDDYLVDPLRARIRPGTRLPHALLPFTPRPDLILVCTASVESVLARKREHSPEECARQLAAFEALAASDGRYRVIRNDGELDDAVDSAIRTLFERWREF